uniref:Diaphanous related formin 2 n=1 Tax=Malurus cyaneus samueli TaxID=2593467 RepID=A0A8C5U1J9_9PASS
MSLQRDRITSFRRAAVKKEKPLIQHPIDSQPSISEIPHAQLVDERCMNLSEKEVMDLFEKMMEDMNLNEERKAPLRDKDLSTKREMVVQYISATAKSVSSHLSQQCGCFTHMQSLRSGISDEKLLNCLESLRVSLTSNPVSWVNNFGHEGLGLLLDALEKLLDKKQQESIDKKNQHKLIQCLKAFMNNKYGLQRILGDERSLLLLSRAIDPKQPHMMTETVKILSALCIVGEENMLDKLLGAITTAAERHSREERFSQIVEGLENHEFIQLQVACMQLINALVTSPDDLDFRIHLRNEFLRCGLKKILPALKDKENDELDIQLRVFDENKDEDHFELSHRLNDIKAEMEYPLRKYTSSENYFLSILQHFLLIRNDYYVRPQYYKIIEECVSQIVLHCSGMDPDFKYRGRMDINFTHLVGLYTLSSFTLFHFLSSPSSTAPSARRFASPPSPLPGGCAPSSPSARGAGCSSSSSLPGGAGPPPPPPLPGGGIPPPPFGGPPMPPPLGGVPFAPFPVMPALPHGMKEKKKYKLEVSMKRINWSKIEPQEIGENSFWVKAEEDKFEDPELFAKLALTFGTQMKAKKPVEESEEKKAAQSKKKIKELRVLDGKSAQNLSIFLGSFRLPYEEIKNIILEVDEEKLSESLIQNLVKNLPEQKELNALAELKDEYNDLAEPEQFGVVMSSVKMLRSRLNGILFRLMFEEHVNNIKPDIMAVTLACEELKKSESFSKLLELVLFLGNYMNSGSRNAQSLGFNISFLCKIRDTKSSDQKTTLLHFLAEICEENYRDILKFPDELQHVESASKVSAQTLKSNLDSMNQQIQRLEKDIENFPKTQDEHDKFVEKMSISFFAREQYEKLSNMHNNMTKLYENLGEYFTFDPKAISIEEFFGDLSNFRTLFLALKENNKRRELEEKTKRAKLAKEKAERERLERQKKKQQLIDMNKEGDETGVMDSLLEALQSGAAFRDRRKRTPRAQGKGTLQTLILNRAWGCLEIIYQLLSLETTGLWWPLSSWNVLCVVRDRHPPGNCNNKGCCCV